MSVKGRFLLVRFLEFCNGHRLRFQRPAPTLRRDRDTMLCQIMVDTLVNLTLTTILTLIRE